jgi:hypothetical protein
MKVGDLGLSVSRTAESQFVVLSRGEAAESLHPPHLAKRRRRSVRVKDRQAD